MNLPNKLTLMRIIMIPFFILFFLLSKNDAYVNNYHIDIYRVISSVIFVVASITDFFDGRIARKYNLITNFGKLMDPLADKLLVISALMMLASKNEIKYLMVLIVVLREVSISAIRLVALEQGKVIAASKWGKYKTATQMIAIVLFLFNIHTINNYTYIIVNFIFYLSMFFVVLSFIDYVVKNFDCIVSGGL